MLARRTNGRDRVTNGRLLPGSVDLRSSSGRRFAHLVRSYTAELGGEPSESQQSLVRQAASIQIRIEQLQADIVGGHRNVDSDEIIRLSSEHRRLVTGLQRHAEQNKPAGPSLQDYLMARAASKAEEEPYGDEADDDLAEAEPEAVAE
jgi:hypothetical protein